MMPLTWVVVWSALPALALSSGPDQCGVHGSSGSLGVSSLLESLQCYNDYSSYLHCKWRKHRNTPLQLWVQIANVKTRTPRVLCAPYGPQGQEEHGTAQCRYKTGAFSIGINHTVFFLENESLTICSSVPDGPLDYSQDLRAHPPVDLSTHDAGDGGRWLRWVSPYPSSSSLNKHLTYQLSYRTHEQDNWTTEEVTNTSMKLEKHVLPPGHRYEARVRVRAYVGQWSDWSPVVRWRTEDTGRLPSLHCVLDGENKVTCSWEVKRERASFITYQLGYRDNRTKSLHTCVSLTVSPVPSGRVLRYSCVLNVTDPAHLLLEFKPTHSAKTFEAHKHIHPNPPKEVKVKERDYSWIVEWTEPDKPKELTLYYQVCYYKTQDQGCSTLLNISQSTSFTLQGENLDLSQQYQVKVRSLVKPGAGDTYGTIPSEWTAPVEWTSHGATRSLTSLMCVLGSVFVATVFFTLYCTIPTCQRRVILWVGSVPSPGKSKILSEIKAATSWTLMQSEDTSICKVLHFNSASTCSSDAPLWPAAETHIKCLEPDKGYWHIDNLPTTAEKVNASDTSSMSFSGPYILCQTSEASGKSVDVKSEEREREEKASSDDSPPPVSFALYGEGYVCLPNRAVSRSAQDLVSRGDASTNTREPGGAEQGPDTTPGPDKTDVQPGLGEAAGRDQPPAYTSTPFVPWPQGGAIHASGYCHLTPLQ